jgi:hypothetical protein
VVLLGIAAFSVNISVIILVLFVWFFSVFAIPYYNGGSGIWATLQNIYKYVSEDFNNDDAKYQDIGIFQKILRMIAGGLHKNMYYAGFILLMVSNLIIMNTSLNSVQLRQIMTAIIVPLIGIMMSFIWGNSGETTKVGVATAGEDLFDNLKKTMEATSANVP